MVPMSIVVLRRMIDAALRRAWSYAFWKIFGVNEDVACDIQLFTGIRALEGTLNSRRVQFRRKLSHSPIQAMM